MSAEKVKSKTASSSSPGDIALDFSGVKGFEPLPETKADGSPAVYLVGIDKLTRAKSSTGNPMSVAEFSVKEPAEYAKRKLFHNFSHQAQALFSLHSLIKAVDPDVELGADFVFNERNYQGLECAVTVVTGQNNRGEDRSNVKNIYPASKYTED